jgi:tetratricopeptide (TPR) repeat protein
LALVSGLAVVIVIAWAVSATWLSSKIWAEKQQVEEQRLIAESNEKEATRQKEIAQENAARAEKHAATARNQVSANVTRVLGLIQALSAELTPKPGKAVTLTDLRTRFVELVKGTTAEIAGDLEGTGITDFARAYAHQRTGYTLNLLGANEEARQQYDLAVTLTRKVVKERPGDDKAVFNLAFLLHELGNATLKSKGEAVKALEYLGEAVELNTLILSHLTSRPVVSAEEKKRAEDAPNY